MVKKVKLEPQGFCKPIASYHQHVKPREPWGGTTEYGLRTSKEIQRKIQEFIGRGPNKDWAHRILDRHRAGEAIPMKAMEYALEVTGDSPAPYVNSSVAQDFERVREGMAKFERQPGED